MKVNQLIKGFFIFYLTVLAMVSTAVIAWAQVDVEALKAQVEDSLRSRQNQVEDVFNDLDSRVKALSPDDYRTDVAEDLLEDANEAVDAFTELNPDFEYFDNYSPSSGASPSLRDYPTKPTFSNAEALALERINAVNRHLISPVQPGAGQPGEEGAVPSGDLIDDFIPQFIRLLMRFATFAVLISFVVSAIFFIASLGNEERTTKAKQMITYTMIGFAFVILAFALIRAVTDIDFFAII